MYTAVKSIAVASVLIVLSIQPGADAARSPYAPSSDRSNDRLSSGLFNPYANEMAGIFQPRLTFPEGLLPALNAVPPVAMIAPDAAAPESQPKYPSIEKFNTEPSVAEPAVPELDLRPMQPVAPPVANVDKAPEVSVPAAPSRDALVAPQAPVQEMLPNEVPSKRAVARPPVRTDLMAFAGPAGAPFAHTRFCLKYPAECRVRKLKFRGGPIDLTAARRQELVRINADVNRSIIGTQMNEPVAQEQWLISPKLGDCNDYAVTKRHKLIAAGWPARALLLAEVVTTWGEHHLVLVVRTRQGDIVADNLNANLRNWTKTPYEWVRVESPVNPLFWSKLKAPEPEVVAMNPGRSRL